MNQRVFTEGHKDGKEELGAGRLEGSQTGEGAVTGGESDKGGGGDTVQGGDC